MKIALYIVLAYVLAIAALKGPLKPYVPACPVVFGFCYDRSASILSLVQGE